MLGNFEKRQFEGGEKAWLGQYRSLTNVLHWHFESELIRVTEGTAQIRIGNHSYLAKAGDAFLCAEEELHYIIGSADSTVDVLILEKSITKDLMRRRTLAEPYLPAELDISFFLGKIRRLLACKGDYYREGVESWARALAVEIFRNCPTAERKPGMNKHNELISKINEEFSFITFQDAVRFCGYSPAHFSKMFRALSGMTFSDYLHVIRIENAIRMIREDSRATVTSISRACGFSTIRNFNRVFRELTGYSPRTLPEGYLLDTDLHISGAGKFDPTRESSVLVRE